MEILITHIHYYRFNTGGVNIFTRLNWPRMSASFPHREVKGLSEDAGVTFISRGRIMVWCFLHETVRSLPRTLSVTPAPDHCDAAEFISTHLFALIVITHPGPVSHPHISAIFSQLWNYGCLTREAEIILHSPFSLPLWLWILLAHNHVRNLKMIPRWDKLTSEQHPGYPTQNTFQRCYLYLLQSDFTLEICSHTSVWCFRLNSNLQHLSTLAISVNCKWL